MIPEVVNQRMTRPVTTLPHDPPDALNNVRLWSRQDDRVKGRDIQTLVSLAEGGNDYPLARGLLQFHLLHTTHVQTGILGCETAAQVLAVEAAVG